MEKKEKNIIITSMMVVGVIFILVAGCIFVRQAWRYIPDWMKQSSLLGIAVICLTGSVLIGIYTNLKKTENALFYIGDVFLGYFTLSVTGVDILQIILRISFQYRFGLAVLAMLIPVLVRLFIKSAIADYVLSVIMMNLELMILFLLSENANVGAYVLGLSVVTIILNIARKLLQNYREKSSGLVVCSKVCGLMQEIITIAWFVGICIMKTVLEYELSLCENLAFIILSVYIVLFALFLHNKEQESEMKVIWIVELAFVLGWMLLYNKVCGTIVDAIILGLVSLVVLIISAIKNNRVYVIISSISLVLICFYVTRAFWLNTAWWVYMFVAGIIMLLIAVKKEKEDA